MQRIRQPHARTTVTATAILLLSLAISPAVFGQYAPIMPLAAQSLLLDIAAAGSRLVAVGERGHILYSDDQGDSWQQSRVPTTQMLTAVFFIDATHGWAVGHDGLILTTDDSGTNWRIQRDGIAAQLQANIEARERNHQQVELLLRQLQTAPADAIEQLNDALGEAELDLEDADLSLAEPVHTPPLMDIWFNDRQRGWAVGAFGALLTTDNGGRSWSNQAHLLDNAYEAHLNAITGDGRGRLFIAGEAGAIFRSLDHGQTWEALPAIYDGSWFGTVYSAGSSTLLVFGLRGNLYRSTDFGENWGRLAVDNQMTLAGGSRNPDGAIVLVGAVGTLLRSEDEGASFYTNILPNRLNLSSGLVQNGQLVVVGQGGVRRVAVGTADE